MIIEAKDFFNQVIKEASKISWPSRKDTLVSSLVVIATSVVVSLIFMLTDSVIYKFINFILNLGS